VEEIALRFALDTGIQPLIANDIGFAVREATANAVIHGNRENATKEVYLTLERRPGILELRVRDEGGGFDMTGLTDPRASDNLLKQTGRGIFLIRHFMDEVQFRNTEPGTEVRLVKYLRGPAARA